MATVHETLEASTRKNTILKSHDRYNESGAPLCDAFVIGIAGGSASGKTHVAHEIVRQLGAIPSVVIMSQDSFYKWNSPEQIALAFANEKDFDHPDSLDLDLFAKCLRDLKRNRQTNVPVYSFSLHQRLDETQYLYGAAIIIVEGILALHDSELRNLYDLKLFVQCDSDLMLARRIRRDVAERGRDVNGVIDQYLRFVKPSFDNFVQPSSRYADVILPPKENMEGINLVVEYIRRKLAERSSNLRERMALTERLLSHTSTPVPASSVKYDTSIESMQRAAEGLGVQLLPQTPQVRGIYTLLRDEKCSKEDFIFYADRLATILVEKAMEALPFEKSETTTPVEERVVGQRLAAKEVCGVTIIRWGGPLERGLQRVLRDIPLGSLLIQPEPNTSEPLLMHCMLPACVRERHRAEEAWVIVLGSQIGTGSTAFMTIRILLDHGVREDRIIFLTFLIARVGGIAVVRRAFPKVRIITGAVDNEVKEIWRMDGGGEGVKGQGKGRKDWKIEPGLGDIESRYF
ncbi:related to uridine kinase [Serendipita indica DSM 11827]|uniref:Uridine kinase n=1 Tax=Serendipita indica (strain DSM 11827) TaxID=1109443 RepID=G4TDF6_SERID|nr:related to uridine kinase [Serendipita indica DSM 11827]